MIAFSDLLKCHILVKKKQKKTKKNRIRESKIIETDMLPIIAGEHGFSIR